MVAGMIVTAALVEVLVASLTALGTVSLSGYLIHLFTRRRTAEGRYDDALTAVARLQAERHTGNLSIPGKLVKATGTELAKIEQDLSVDGVKRFLEARADARAALAALYPYSPDLRRYWDKVEISDAELDELTQLLLERRRKPTKVHPAAAALPPGKPGPPDGVALPPASDT
jgi:hypothetical protein